VRRAIGHVLAANGKVWRVCWLAKAVLKDRHAAFLTAMWAHLASYAPGTIGELSLCVITLWRRYKFARRTP